MPRITARKQLGETVTDEVRTKAIEQGRQLSNPLLPATSLRYMSGRHALEVSTPQGPAVTLLLTHFHELDALTPLELAGLTLGFGGEALCHDELDLHISLAGLLEA